MADPEEKPARSTEGQSGPAPNQPRIGSSNDNNTQRFSLAGLGKTLGIGAAILSGAGWLIHNYAAPATESVWNEMLRPRLDNLMVDEMRRSPHIHEFMVSEINDYISGTIASPKTKPSVVGAKLKELAGGFDQIEAMSGSLFGSVDSVYPVRTEFNLRQIRDKASNTISYQSSDSNTAPITLFVYADPDQHCLYVYVQAKGDFQRGSRKEKLNLSIILNNTPLKAADNVSAFTEEIGALLKPRQGTGGNGKEEEEGMTSSIFSQNIQKIEIKPMFPTFDAIRIVGPSDNIPEEEPAPSRIEGYVLVTRRKVGGAGDCRQRPRTASTGNDIQ